MRSRQAGPDRFAQWSGRNEAAIAKSVFRVNDDKRQVLSDPRVLEPVVEHDNPGAGRQCCAASGGPVARHPARPVSRQQQRLVADRQRIMPHRIDPHRPGETPAIAARHDVRRGAASGNEFEEREDDRRLSRPAGD